jgi:hypothetical protein
MAHAKVECWEQADEILQMEIGRLNRNFWVVEHPPKAVLPPILGAFSI